jgi:hypothetical protein
MESVSELIRFGTWVGHGRDHGDKHPCGDTHAQFPQFPGDSLPQPWRVCNRICCPLIEIVGAFLLLRSQQ